MLNCDSNLRLGKAERKQQLSAGSSARRIGEARREDSTALGPERFRLSWRRPHCSSAPRPTRRYRSALRCGLAELAAEAQLARQGGGALAKCATGASFDSPAELEQHMLTIATDAALAAGVFRRTSVPSAPRTPLLGDDNLVPSQYHPSTTLVLPWG